MGIGLKVLTDNELLKLETSLNLLTSPSTEKDKNEALVKIKKEKKDRNLTIEPQARKETMKPCTACNSELIDTTKIGDDTKSYVCITDSCEQRGKVISGGFHLGSKNPIKVVVDQLIYDLEHRPEDFTCGEDTLDDRVTGIKYIYGHYEHGTGVYSPNRMDFGMIQCWRAKRAIANWKAVTLINKQRQTSKG